MFRANEVVKFPISVRTRRPSRPRSRSAERPDGVSRPAGREVGTTGNVHQRQPRPKAITRPPNPSCGAPFAGACFKHDGHRRRRRARQQRVFSAGR